MVEKKIKTKVDRRKIGKQNRAKGLAFERKVRVDLTNKGWIVIKNPNNVIDNEFKQGKSKYNPFTKQLMMSSGGFPDYIIYSPVVWATQFSMPITAIIGCEVKSNGYLDKEERVKCDWMLNNNIFSRILIAQKDKSKRGKIKYEEYKPQNLNN